jgi:hypothetical protein
MQHANSSRLRMEWFAKLFPARKRAAANLEQNARSVGTLWKRATRRLRNLLTLWRATRELNPGPLVPETNV